MVRPVHHPKHDKQGTISMTPTQTRLTAIINAGVLSERDVAFARDLLAYYNKKKVMTAGRRVWVDRLEAKIAEIKANPPVVAGDLLARIDALRAVGNRSTWETDILASFHDQVKHGRKLSPKQTDLIAKIEKADADNAAWTFGTAERERWKFAVTYYRHNPPYFADAVAFYDGNPNAVPAKRMWDKVCNNKHTNIAWDSHIATPKFAAGDQVTFQSNITSSNRRYHYITALRKAGRSAGVSELDSAYAKNVAGMILSADAAPVVSAAKGTKRYSVLFYGATAPILVEERDLRKNKAVRL